MTSSVFQMIIIIVTVLTSVMTANVCTDQAKCNPTQEFAKELVETLIPQQQLSKYQEAYDAVKAAIYSIAPKSRDIHKSHQIIEFAMGRIDDILPDLIEDVADELQLSKTDENFRKIQHKIRRQADLAKKGAKSKKERYVNIKLSFEAGGRSHILVGGIGFRRIDDNDVVFGISMYEENWVEQDWVRLNQHPLWADQMVEKFAFYLLYQNVKDRLG